MTEAETVKPATVAEALSWVSKYLDLSDNLIEKVGVYLGVDSLPERSDEVQRDLLRLADWFRAHPVMAGKAWEFATGEPVPAPAPSFEWAIQFADRTDSDWNKPETLRLQTRGDSLDPPYTEATARARVKEISDGLAGPDFARVVRRAVGEWEPC